MGRRPHAFGQTIRARREEKGVSLRAVARRAGLSAAYLSDIETGKEDAPAEKKVRAIARELDLDPDVLLIQGNRVPPDLMDAMQEEPRKVAASIRQNRTAVWFDMWSHMTPEDVPGTPEQEAITAGHEPVSGARLETSNFFLASYLLATDHIPSQVKPGVDGTGHTFEFFLQSNTGDAIAGFHNGEARISPVEYVKAMYALMMWIRVAEGDTNDES